MSLSPRLEEKVGELYDRLNEAVKNPDILSIHDQFFLIGSAMSLVEEIPGLKGWEKKLIVETALNKIVGKISRELKNDLLIKILTPDVISTLIELVISASKGEFHINERCLKRFICF